MDNTDELIHNNDIIINDSTVIPDPDGGFPVMKCFRMIFALLPACCS